MLSRRQLVSAITALIPSSVLYATAAPSLPKIPRVIGICLNVEAQLDDAAALLYRVSDESVRNVAAVYDGGVNLLVVDDFPDRRSLLRVHVPPGYVKTCIREGLFRLGGPPFFCVTADVEGDRPYPSRLFTDADIAGCVTPARREHFRRFGLLQD